jgi:sugar/nucleoside kinase (ribokinase family)
MVQRYFIRLDIPETGDMIQLVCLGRVTIDLLNLVDHFPTGDDLIRVIDSSIQGGGPVGTAAAAAARLGVNTAVVDCLGNDWRAP